MQKRRVYLDHSATTPLDPAVLEAMKPCLGEVYGNASSVHSFGQEARRHMEDARALVARLLNAAKPEEIIFTGSGTEADNLAVKGVALACRSRGGHIITSGIEHHAVLYTCEYLEKQGFGVTYLKVDGHGRVDPAEVSRSLTPRTVLVSVMHANNEVGTVQPVREIGELLAAENARRFAAGAPRVYFHSDAVQTAGKLPVDVQALGVDLLSVSAHKFYGPKGMGALYLRRGTPLEPLLHGGHHERNLRAGTENVAGIAGLARALERSLEGREKEQARLKGLRDKLEKGIIERIPAVKVNGHPAERLASVLNVSFDCVEGESVLLSLDLEGVAASTGSACASGSLETSHVLKAMGVEPALAQGTLRFSLGHQNTEEDIDYVLGVLPRIVERLRGISPLWAARKTEAGG